jgi:ABC-type antimicrobial peptide transport system permease subunit
MRLRLALTSLGVVIGTSAIVLMISLGIGLEDNITQGLGELGAANQITVMPAFDSPGGRGTEALDEEQVEEFAQIEHVEAVVPTVMVQTAQNVEYKRQAGYMNLVGLPEDGPEMLGYDI